MADDNGIFGNIKEELNKFANLANDEKEKVQNLAREHGLDPNHVQDWPEEVKSKLPEGIRNKI